jgi:hypothetical protein
LAGGELTFVRFAKNNSDWYANLMKHVKFFAFTLFVAFIMALLEVQIEGRMGWAAALPTWRKILPFSFFGMFGYAGKPLTGYHLYLWILLLTLPHFAFFFTEWTPKKEFLLLSFYVFFTTFEGILWFLVNPAYGWQNFTPKRARWYRQEPWLGIPLEYYPRFIVGGILYWLANADIKVKALRLPKLRKKTH